MAVPASCHDAPGAGWTMQDNSQNSYGSPVTPSQRQRHCARSDARNRLRSTTFRRIAAPTTGEALVLPKVLQPFLSSGGSPARPRRRARAWAPRGALSSSGRKLPRNRKYIARVRIPRFESSDPSQAVGLRERYEGRKRRGPAPFRPTPLNPRANSERFRSTPRTSHASRIS
jgi:hypothetical protein